jgi:hypothetical protein
MTVLTCNDVDFDELRALLERYALQLQLAEAHTSIPGSYWGDPEAGLVGSNLIVRADTPVHSALHEACHYICMDGARRDRLHTDAGGDTNEENGVCYLQILLADHIRVMGRARMWADMDAWGYSFRLGSARAWFEHDAGDARDWLTRHALLRDDGTPTWRLRA